jgi:hypothetical protein
MFHASIICESEYLGDKASKWTQTGLTPSVRLQIPHFLLYARYGNFLWAGFEDEEGRGIYLVDLAGFTPCPLIIRPLFPVLGNDFPSYINLISAKNVRRIGLPRIVVLRLLIPFPAATPAP